jgi:hypothetical protein
VPNGTFSNKNPNLGIFWRALEYKMLVYFMAIWNIWQPFGIPYSHLVHFWSFGVFLHVLVCFTHINLATLPQTHFAGAWSG